ncbi:MAG: hypothetical protein WDZ72_13570 [Cyclobacteriaceae bacterium]
MKWVKEYFIKKALDSKKENTGNNNPMENKNIKTVGIIAKSKEEIEDIIEVVHSDLSEDIQVYGWYYDENNVDEQSFSHKDFTLFGKPGEKLNQFLSLQPDLIIFTFERLNYFTLYLLHLKPESYRMGFYSEEIKPFLDLMLNNEEKDIKSGTELLIKYLKQIN